MVLTHWQYCSWQTYMHVSYLRIISFLYSFLFLHCINVFFVWDSNMKRIVVLLIYWWKSSERNQRTNGHSFITAIFFFSCHCPKIGYESLCCSQLMTKCNMCYCIASPMHRCTCLAQIMKFYLWVQCKKMLKIYCSFISYIFIYSLHRSNISAGHIKL